MQREELIRCLRGCRRYQQARSWQKPWIDPVRFLRNQLVKRRLLRPDASGLRSAAPFFGGTLTVVAGEAVSEEIASYGVYEPDLTEAFLRLVRPGEVVVDIGMHLGYYTALFSLLVGETGQVHAFEPTPSTRQLAAKNVQHLGNVHVHPAAVWSTETTLPFQDFGWQWMAFNSVRPPRLAGAAPVSRMIEVHTISLDQFRRTTDRKVSLVKIDAESAEQDILSGAIEFLDHDHPLVTLEVGDKPGLPSSRSLVDFMSSRGYAAWEPTSGGFVRHEPQATYDYTNLVFAPAALDLAGI
jgi:FkbM family methyltransferase